MGTFLLILFSIFFTLSVIAVFVFAIISYGLFVADVVGNNRISYIKTKEDFQTSLLPFGYFYVVVKNKKGFK